MATQVHKEIASGEEVKRPKRKVVFLAAPGLILFLVGFGLMFSAYVGRTHGNLALALCGVGLLLAGVFLALAAAIILIVRLSSRDDYRVIRGVNTRASAVNDTPETATIVNARNTAPQADTAEQLLFSFGPFGVDICSGPFKIFSTWHRRNSAIIELTNKRLCALPNKSFGFLTIPAMKYPWGAQLPFEISYDSIISIELQKHPSPIALMEVLDIKYKESGVSQEKCIASYKNTIRRAYETIIAATLIITP